jgi:AraC-like DNA-binding protein
MSYISTKLKESIKIDKIITIHYFEYMKHFFFKGESHDFWEFLCVDKGEIQVTADDNKYMLKKGDIIFHKPMEFHALRSIGDTAPNLVVISFETPSPDIRLFEDKIFTINSEQKMILSNILSEARRAFSTPIHIPSVEQVKRSEDAHFGSEQLIKLYLEMLLITLARDMKNIQVNPSEKLSAFTITEKTCTMDSILSYLESHIFEKLTVKQICSGNLISRSSLETLFNQEKGCGVIDYFNKMKIDRAKEIIRTGRKSISEISNILSYSSPQYFSKQFKIISGMSPKEYEKSIKSLSESFVKPH